MDFRFEIFWKKNVFTELLQSLREISLELAHALTKVFWCWLTTVKERFFSIKDQRVVAIYSVADTINFYYNHYHHIPIYDPEFLFLHQIWQSRENEHITVP